MTPDQSQIMTRLIADEGIVPHAYQDHLGFWSIGIGRLIDERRGGGLSRDEIVYLLRNDVEARTTQCAERFPWFSALDAPRQQAIVCMAFQLGVNGVANFRRMCAALAFGDFEMAANEALDSDWARNQTPARARRMAKIIRTGVWQ